MNRRPLRPADGREFRRGTQLGAAHTLTRVLRRPGMPSVLSWEITQHGTLRGRLAEDDAPAETIRSLRRFFGGKVRCCHIDGHRALLLRTLVGSWYVDLWLPSPLPIPARTPAPDPAGDPDANYDEVPADVTAFAHRASCAAAALALMAAAVRAGDLTPEAAAASLRTGDVHTTLVDLMEPPSSFREEVAAPADADVCRLRP
ncbi:hypothetical protein GCM10009801_73070 [Streptomyces albiaxialis]|uniref:Uncharacterized protein n=1 Tax=Streptomyces albiaxialis TaxID=329523 RepID=A0ABP5IKW3_9ACTN